MEGKNWGDVGPIYGRWHWPITHMQPGDYFYVDHALRNPEQVRHYVSVRAAQLGVLMSVMANDPDRPGFAKVLMRDPDEQKLDRPDGAILEYGSARDKLMDWYGFYLDNAPFGLVITKGSARVNVTQLNEPSVKRLITDVGADRIGIVMDDDGFDMLWLPKGSTLESWKVEPSLEDVMG